MQARSKKQGKKRRLEGVVHSEIWCILPSHVRVPLGSEWRDPTMSSRARHGLECEFPTKLSVYGLSAAVDVT